MRLLLDEMFAGLKEFFEILGWKVITVQEAGLQGAKDREVVEYAKKNDLILVTQDEKPADLAELLGVKYVLVSRSLIARIVDAKIREKYGMRRKSKEPSV
ncbi:DUF5615 family PIN-like protein [Candidatus Bathyarchaeota archaeon]|nr:DUF5615 family PIN-like protein [Candidatus Bathyarchaeota archaeon]